MKIFTEEDRKKTHIAEKSYVTHLFGSVVRILSAVKQKINVTEDEILVSEITRCKEILEGIVDDLTYEE